jgi:hypothetical protein
MSERVAGAALITAALGFWLAWTLMPAVGVTDTQRIFALVGVARLRGRRR